ncbi:MAG: patatin-like phospholipase family protein [Legionellales bacterium]|jgi:ankyrin repeat protein
MLGIANEAKYKKLIQREPGIENMKNSSHDTQASSSSSNTQQMQEVEANQNTQEKALTTSIAFSLENISQLRADEIRAYCLRSDTDHLIFKAIIKNGSADELNTMINNPINKAIKIKTDVHGNTSPHVAMMYGRTELLPIFKEHKMNCDKENQWGLQPLHYAVAFNDIASLTWFIGNLGVGASEYLTKKTDFKYGNNLSESHRMNIVSWAFLTSDNLTVECILEAVNLKDRPDALQVSDFGTLIHVAVWRNSVELLHNLLKHETARNLLNTEDKNGRTPLSLASQLGHIEAMLSLLRSSDVQANLPSGNNQWTPLHWAIHGKQTAAVNLLLHYVDPNKPAKNQVTATEFLHTKQATLTSLGSRTSEQDYDLAIYEEIEEVLKEGYQTNPYMGTVSKFKPAIQRNYTNLAINGGGAKGMLFPFALESLQIQLKKPDFLNNIQRVAGTSAGSITALFIALGCEASQIKDIMLGNDVTLNHNEILLKLDIDDLTEGCLETPLSTDLPTSTPTPLSFETIYQRLIETGQTFLAKGFEKIKQGARVGRNIWNLNFHQGAVSGTRFIGWLEKNIEAKLKAEGVYSQGKRDGLITFKEWKQLVINDPTKQFKHLYISVTQLSPAIKPLVLNTEFVADDEWYANMPIADAIRASMSIPLVFMPYVPRQRIVNGTAPFSDRLFVDGGLLLNYPLHEFDKAYYFENALRKPEKWDLGKMTRVNHNTLGLCLVTSNETDIAGDAQNLTVKKILTLIKDLYWNNEQLAQSRSVDDTPRTVFLQCHIKVKEGEFNIDTMDFHKTQNPQYITVAKFSSLNGVQDFLAGNVDRSAFSSNSNSTSASTEIISTALKDSYDSFSAANDNKKSAQTSLNYEILLAECEQAYQKSQKIVDELAKHSHYPELQEGKDAESRGDKTEAIVFYRRVANNSAKAKTRLATLLLEEKSTQEEGIKFLQQAASEKDPRAMHKWATVLYGGKYNIKQDISGAMKIFNENIQQQYPSSTFQSNKYAKK